MKSLLRPLELFLRHVIAYPVFRLLFRNSPHEGVIDLRTVRKILILRYDRIGDIIVTTPIFKMLKAANPDLFIGVLASPSNAELLRRNTDVDRIHVLHSNWLKLVRMVMEAKGEQYDVVLNFIFNRTTSGGVLANLIAPRGIKIGQGAEKYRFYFNRLLDLRRGTRHMVEVLAGFVETVFGAGVRSEDLSFRIALDDSDWNSVRAFLDERKLGRHSDGNNTFVVMNISATDEVRRISTSQAEKILRILTTAVGCPVVIVSAPKDDQWKQKLVDGSRTSRVHSFPPKGIATLRELAALIGSAGFVVTPDTSIIHFASAMQTPVLGLFTPLQVTAEWLPFGVNSRAVLAEIGQPVSTIRTEVLEKEILAFAHELKMTV